MILTAVNEAGSSYGIAYSDFAGCYAAFSDAVSFLHSADYQAAIQLTEAANTLLGSYVSDYDGSTGLTGFLTDAGYYSAVQDLLSSELQCGSALSDIRAALDRGQEDYEAGLLEYEAGLEEYQENEQLLAESRVSLDNAKSELDSALAQLEAGETALAETRATLDEGWYALSDGRQQLDEGWNSYYSGLQALEEGRAQLQQETAEAQQQLDAALQELEDGEADYASGLADYEEGLATFQSEIAEAEETIAENEQKLSDARTELDELEPADIYLLGRDMNVGYICFQNDTQIIARDFQGIPHLFLLSGGAGMHYHHDPHGRGRPHGDRHDEVSWLRNLYHQPKIPHLCRKRLADRVRGRVVLWHEPDSNCHLGGLFRHLRIQRSYFLL